MEQRAVVKECLKIHTSLLKLNRALENDECNSAEFIEQIEGTCNEVSISKETYSRSCLMDVLAYVQMLHDRIPVWMIGKRDEDSRVYERVREIFQRTMNVIEADARLQQLEVYA